MYGGEWGWYHGGWWYPARYPRDYEPTYNERPRVTQGYLAYPYANDEGSGSTFVNSRATYRRAFGAVTATGFSDVGSTTRAGHLAIEGAYGLLHGSAEYGQYVEPVAGHTDHLNTARFSVGVLPRLGDRAYLVAGIGARGIILDDGSYALGPEVEAGVQLFPVRPLGATVTYRIAGLRWNGATDNFSLAELNATGSVFIGRVELQAGWHWMKLGGSPAFGGPVVGTRIWF